MTGPITFMERLAACYPQAAVEHPLASCNELSVQANCVEVLVADVGGGVDETGVVGRENHSCPTAKRVYFLHL